MAQNRFFEKFDKSEKYDKSEVAIDRDQENRDVDLYNRTKDDKVLEKVFQNRVPTLKYWAAKHYFPGLSLSLEDFYGELVIVFMKTVKGFQYGRGSFNTCLYTFLLNRIKNIKSGRYAKKRKPDHYEGSINNMILSLDYEYSEKDGKSITLEEKLENEDSNDYDNINGEINLKESVHILANGDPKLKNVLVRLGRGDSINCILKHYKTKEGKIKLDSKLKEELENASSEKIIINKIKELSGITDFKLISYNVGYKFLKYTVEFKKTQETDSLAKSLRKIKKDKKYYLELFKDEKYRILA